MIVITSTFIADVMHSQLIERLQPAPPTILFSYQQIFSQLLLADSEFQKNRQGYNILLIRLSDLLPYTTTPQSPVIEQFISEFSCTLTTAYATMQTPLLILFCPTPDHLGEKTEFYTHISLQIQQKIQESTPICILQPSEILQHTFHQMIDSPVADQLGQRPYTLEFYQVLSDIIVEKTSKKTSTIPSVETHLVQSSHESLQNLLQNKIIAIFADVLQIDASLIGIHTAFFDLGGTSITAIRLIQTLNAHFHVSIQFSTLYDQATAKLLSEQISQILSKTQFVSLINQSQMHQHALKQIKVGEPSHPPLVFIHPLGGTGCCYLDLIKALPDEQPCYLIQDPSIDAHQLLFDDIVSMATYYNHLVLKHVSTEPFILAGYAFGGIIALEMIRQLEQKNLADGVHSLLAFDTWIQGSPQAPSDYYQIPERVTASESDSPSWMATYYSQLQSISMAYIPSRISKKIVLFKATQPTKDFATGTDDAHSLKGYTTHSVETHFISSDHASILQWPHTQVLSQIITQYLQEPIHGMA